MNTCAIVIFGATGDLAKRKLIPALYRLMVAQKLTNFVVLGAAIGDTTAHDIMESAHDFITDKDGQIWQQLKERFYYQQLNFNVFDDYSALNVRLQELEKQYCLSGNRILYLASAASFFCAITEYSARAGLAHRIGSNAKPWQRIVYEKPFGHDLPSAHHINESIARVFDEHQVYRIDHYLTKELVSNITLMRFANCFFEPLWNNTYIDQVQIVLSEQIGIEGRGAYYDAYGALRDVVQNHILELLALIGMEQPYKLAGDFIRANRAQVIEKVRIIDGFLGQYEGYAHHEGVNVNSTTETFAMLCLGVDTPRWQGVPFYIKTGKRLDKKETVIHIKFKQINCLLLRGCPLESNWLTMKIVPDATFSLSLNIKKPGRTDELLPAAMEFCHSCIFGERAPEEAYEILLEEVMRAEQATAVRFDEIEYAWRVIDELYARKLPMYIYKQGCQGPQEIKNFEKQHGMEWRS
ncbi:MAG: glucose-6-phosphate dehydrogenase [Candidatus Dependentiae bacterium]|nr:glucose-6-phosphate dehydrogenase [Candidatus Dependentiae bacterium]